MAVVDLVVTLASNPLKRICHRRVVVRNISDIADGAWRTNRGRDQTKRQKAAADLRERLSWKKFEELQ